jgi:hypothetical protein
MDLPSNTSMDSEDLLRYWKRVLYVKRPMMNRIGPEMARERRGLIPKIL